MLDQEARLIAAVVDLNPAKQDRRLGGGGHRVLAPEAAAALSPRSVFVMNPAYADEITRYVARKRLGRRNRRRAVSVGIARLAVA